MLVSHGDVLNRLAGIPGLKVPDTVGAERIDSHIRNASATVLLKSGYATPPREGTPERDVLNDACIRLAVNSVLADLRQTNADMKEALRRERQDILKELEAVAPNVSESGIFFDVTGGSTS